MFELLLQADKAMADGAFDRAERTYWQLIELDPSNSIAIAGLARISLQRGDERFARTFAGRALRLDPDSIDARRVLAALAQEGPASDEPAPPDLSLVAAQRLEALSRRRMTGEPGAGTAPPGQAAASSAEFVREARHTGRSGAAADTPEAADDAVESVRPRHQPHRAMPMGRRAFEPGELRAQPRDAFSDAEIAAAVEAVDALDEVGADEFGADGAGPAAPAAPSQSAPAAEPSGKNGAKVQAPRRKPGLFGRFRGN